MRVSEAKQPGILLFPIEGLEVKANYKLGEFNQTDAVGRPYEVELCISLRYARREENYEVTAQVHLNHDCTPEGEFLPRPNVDYSRWLGTSPVKPSGIHIFDTEDQLNGMKDSLASAIISEIHRVLDDRFQRFLGKQQKR